MVQGGPIAGSTIQKAAGKIDSVNRERIIELGAAALGRITEAATSFYALDHVSRRLLCAGRRQPQREGRA